LVIAGGWSGRFPEAEREASRLESLNHWAGVIRFVHDPSDGNLRYLYEHALGFVFPSMYEGFGLPILEAMQAGLPIAASSAPAVAEVAGDAALLFDPVDVRSMSSAILQLSEDREGRARLARAARERVNSFSWQVASEKTLHAYEVVLCA
jgi:alpha-1,3-rhamnosyl/mannosyltransferase